MLFGIGESAVGQSFPVSPSWNGAVPQASLDCQAQHIYDYLVPGGAGKVPDPDDTWGED